MATTTPPAFSVEQALDDHVALSEEPRLPDGKWHPSSLYGCPRKAVYEVRGVEPTNPVDARGKRVFRVGHILHNFVQDAVERKIGESLTQAYREVPVSLPELNVVGTGDGLVQFASGFWELQEYKSINSTAFRYRDLPKTEHVGQVTPYLLALQRHGSPDNAIPPLGDALTRARLTYVSKDDLRVEEHTVLLTEAKIADLEGRVAWLNPYREGTSLPPRLKAEGKSKTPWQCGYCAFQTRCYDTDTEAEMKPVN
jgi:hypothetical protein